MAWRELVPTLFGDHNEAIGVTSDSVGETAGQVVVIGAAVLVAMTNSHHTTPPE